MPRSPAAAPGTPGSKLQKKSRILTTAEPTLCIESLFHGGLTVQMSSQSTYDMLLRRENAKLENARKIEG
jgi:hypothetical protein